MSSGAWECVQLPAVPHEGPAGFCQAIEQVDTSCEGRLLARKGVDYAFENCRKTRRFHSFKSFRQTLQAGIARGDAVKIPKVDP